MRNANSKSIVPRYCAVKISNLILSSRLFAAIAQERVAETHVVRAESSGEGSGNCTSGKGRTVTIGGLMPFSLFDSGS